MRALLLFLLIPPSGAAEIPASGAYAELQGAGAELTAAAEGLAPFLEELASLGKRYGRIREFQHARRRRGRLRARIQEELKTFDRDLRAYREMSRDAGRALATDALAQLLTRGVKQLELGPALGSQRVLRRSERFLRDAAEALEEDEAAYRSGRRRVLSAVGGVGLLAAGGLGAAAVGRLRRRRAGDAAYGGVIPLTMRIRDRD